MNIIKYLNELKQNYIQFGIKGSICLSKNVLKELDYEDSEVIIWLNRNDKVLYITSKEEYYKELNDDVISYYDDLNYRAPVLLTSIKNPEKIEKIYNILTSNEDYLVKLENLINVFDKQKTLMRK